ncbi:MAG: hypothetical protein J7513_04365 [Solirubrobacteraceae bacterium]|nr:hypothetical protein [Solirubrobacteraceae bacterium]
MSTLQSQSLHAQRNGGSAPARTPVITAIRTGTPGHRLPQAEAQRVAASQFPEIESSPDLLGVFDHAEIDERQLARPSEWYVEPHGFAEKNAVYREEALALATRLIGEALDDAGVEPEQIDAVVFVSTTGLSTPSLEAQLIQDLGLSRNAVRVPLWGLGCAGGAAGLARAADLVRAGHAHVLLVAVEFCSLTFQMGDDDKANLIGTALFADGGAALVLGAEETAGTDDARAASLVRILHTHSELLDDSAALTGWDVIDDGFKLRLAPEIPQVVAANLRRVIDASLADAGWVVGDLDAVVVHPGGAKVIAGYEAVLGVDSSMLDPARAVLRQHGNMSSPTVLFVLAETLARGTTGRGLISATGPGFSAEHLLVELV